ncbi:MAG: hypothetical protein HKM95_16185 [Inquilinus sp.]|nr:hypothetical protein [Inquilinus sp.]
MDAAMAAVYRPHSPDWYDGVWTATAPLRNSRQEAEALPLLGLALDDDDTVVRRHAAFVLQTLARRWREEPPADFIAALTAALTDDDAQVRESAARGLGQLPSGPAVEASLTAAARDPAPRVRWAAITGLAGWNRSEAAATPLFDAFDDPDPRTRYAATFGLQRFLRDSPNRQESVAEDLIARMAAGDVSDRHVAAYQMGLSALPSDERHLPALIALAESADPVIRRRAAAELLGQLLRQHREGALDRDLLARQLDLHRADLMDDDAEVRVGAAWSLRGYRNLDTSSLPHIDAALAIEPDYENRFALRYVRASLAGEDPDRSGDPGWVYYRDLCLPHESFSVMGLRPWDDERKVVDLLGEPAGITAGWSEDDGGAHIVLGYEYAALDIEIARSYTQRIATRSAAVIVGGGLRVGLSRQRALAVLGVAPSTEALAARRFAVGNCDLPAETALNLEFGEDGRIVEIAIEGYGP